jgi:peptidoglycan/LPS O-acetylase OafA/YrhL
LSRLKALDGLRALAVIAVLASHTLPRAHGGFLGVDVFFVLSGYLITSLLIKEYEAHGRIDFAGFYRRRVARLFPAYLLMIALAIPLMIGPLRGVGTWPWQEIVAASAVYGANWAQAFDVDHMGPLLHTWSLSVEEQFYLFWPISFVLLIRFRRSLVAWLSGAALITVVVRAVGWQLHPGLWPYFATFTHGDGLLVGALIAVLMAPRSRTRRSASAGAPDAVPTGRRARPRPQRPASALARMLLADRYSGPFAWIGAAVLAPAMLVLTMTDGATYWFGLTGSALATGLMVRHLVISSSSPMARLLSLPPLVAIGRVSYGLYLYHMPIFMLVQSRHLGFATVLLLESGGTAVITVASWYLVEQPAQRWVTRRWPRETTRPAPSVTAAPGYPPVASLAHEPQTRPTGLPLSA